MPKVKCGKLRKSQPTAMGIISHKKLVELREYMDKYRIEPVTIQDDEEALTANLADKELGIYRKPWKVGDQYWVWQLDILTRKEGSGAKT